MTRVFSVSEINHYIKGLITEDILLSSVFVRGEISNLNYHASGHIYFSLKDKKGTISAVMFSSSARKLRFRLRAGDTVTAAGYIDVYEAGGKYQLYVKDIRPEGSGELYEKYLRLKAQLEEEGMFDPRYKKPVPRYVHTVGIVTAPGGAAIRDIEQITARRNPYVQLILYPALVQGNGAAQSIAEGIRVLDAMGLDVLIVGRGGGSIEDLWAFNEEIVARAVFNCRTPVISAVGHETDTTIIDYAADLRAPTPSAAAELAVFDVRKFFENTAAWEKRLAVPLERQIRLYREKERRHSALLRMKSPQRQISDLRMRAISAEDRMKKAENRAVESAKDMLARQEERIRGGMKETFRVREQRLVLNAQRLHGLSPLRRLRQGFSYMVDESGKTVRSVADVKTDEHISVYVSDGKIFGTVSGTEQEKFYGAETEE